MSTQLDIPGTARRSWSKLTQADARRLLEAFRASKLDAGQWCRRMGYSRAGLVRTMRRTIPAEWSQAMKDSRHRSTPYRLGAAFEYRVMHDLERTGWHVYRSPGSRSPADVIAIRAGVELLIQCRRAGNLLPTERQALVELAESVGAVPLLAGNPEGRGIRYWLAEPDGVEEYRP